MSDLGSGRYDPAPSPSAFTLSNPTPPTSGLRPQFPGVQPSSPPRRSHTLRNVLIVVGVVLVLCCGGGAYTGYRLFSGVKGAVGEVKAAGETFLQDLEGGDLDRAYNGLCDDTRARFSRERFEQYVSARPELTGYAVTGYYIRNYNGHASATFSATLQYVDGSSEQHIMPMRRSDDESRAWKVCGDPY